MNILIAADGSESSARTIDFVVKHHQWLLAGPSTTVLTVVPELPGPTREQMSPQEQDAYVTRQAESVLDPIRTMLMRLGFNARLAVAQGPPALAICDYADAGGFELVVVGSHGHGAITSMLLGSVATHVLAKSPVPVLIVKPSNGQRRKRALSQ